MLLKTGTATPRATVPMRRRTRGLLALAATAAALPLLAQSPTAAASTAAAARAEEIVQGQCLVCHGAEGESSSPAFPRLAGQNAGYLARQLADYQSGKRKSSTMQPMVKALRAEDFMALGEYFATRPTHAHEMQEPQLAQAGRDVYVRGNPSSGVAACATCHGAEGHGSASLPRLAGQHAQYTERQLRQFHQRERTNDNAVMQAVASRMTDQEMKAVAAYLSGLK